MNRGAVGIMGQVCVSAVRMRSTRQQDFLGRTEVMQGSVLVLSSLHQEVQLT